MFAMSMLLNAVAGTPSKSGSACLLPMHATLQIALLALVPVCMLFAGSAILFFRAKTVASFLQLLGAGCLVIVVLTHLAESLHLFPWMNWGRPRSIGHYLDFWSAVLGLTLFPVGYLFHVLSGSNRRFKLKKRSRLFIRMHNKPLSVAAMCVSNPVCSPPQFLSERFRGI
jgi:hypothetical protein